MGRVVDISFEFVLPPYLEHLERELTALFCNK